MIDNDDTNEFTFDWQYEFDVFGKTDIGRVRELNEDQFLVFEMTKETKVLSCSFEIDESEDALNGSKGLIMVVADGVSGSAAGERASQLAAAEIHRHLRGNMSWIMGLHHENVDELLNALKTAVSKCELAVEMEAQLIPEEQGMGTTLTLAYLIWPSMYVVHVGDSRCYICRNSKMLQVTRDHTYAQALLEAGELKPHEAKTSQYRNVLVNSIGKGMEYLHPEVYVTELEEGDRLLLCTDGLTDMLEDPEIATILNQSTNSGDACENLINAGLNAGGRDNLTAIVCMPNLKLDEEL